MLTVDCPWCDEPMLVDDAAPAAATCVACGVTAEFAPDVPSFLVDIAA